ncbi:MAG: ABC transporter permease [Candidatus Heimdallarchaeota archaeon]|nr:ABC transporter permease [Candidatus Heimdallarchaeota archaeon]
MTVKFVSEKPITRFTPLNKSGFIKLIIGVFLIEFALLFLAWLLPVGGIFYSQSFNNLVTRLGNGQYIFYSRAMFGIKFFILKTTIISLLNFVCILLIGLYQSHPLVQRFNIILTSVFTYTLISILYYATRNLALIYLAIFFIATAYWYFIRYGEIGTFFGNPIIIFVLRRSLSIIPMFLGITMFMYFGVDFIGDPVAIAVGQLRRDKDRAISILMTRWGLLDEDGQTIPVYERYLVWIYNFIHGKLGISYRTSKPVEYEISLVLWETVKLNSLAFIISIVLSLIIGIITAYYHQSVVDSLFSAFALFGTSMPIFVIGVFLILIFGGTNLDWFPTSGAHALPQNIAKGPCGDLCRTNPGDYWNQNSGNLSTAFLLTYFKILYYHSLDSLKHLALPLFTLTIVSLAGISRITRSSMLDILRQDYILAARANGLSERDVIMKHALRNVLLPIVTIVGLSIPGILAGAPITETVFTWPGLGLFFLAAIPTLDMNVLMASAGVFTLLILFFNMVTDIAYIFVDPRITL